MSQDSERLLGGRYQLLTVHGRGGMGAVWRAKDVMLDRTVAVKEVTFGPGLSAHEKDVLKQRTLREARASARLNHPNVVTVHDVVEQDGRPWIVMEFVEADSLQDVLDAERTIQPWRAADIGRQVLDALKAAHDRGILHRDVKPSNILITKSGRVVLTDFGIAQMEGDVTLTQTGLVMGSPAYIPPERVQGERAVPASDLWSLGATLFAAVEGHAPFERADAMAALSAALTEPVPRPQNAGQLTRVLEGLLVREPASRMTSEQALPLLTDVSHSRPNTIPQAQATQFDETILDRVPAKEDSPLETILDSSRLNHLSQQARQQQAARQSEDDVRTVFQPREDEVRTVFQPRDEWNLGGAAQPVTNYSHQNYQPPPPPAQPYQQQGNLRTTMIIVLSIIVAITALGLGIYIIAKTG